MDPEIKDVGRYAVTLEAADSFLFKVPSLRNLSYTYPYMHDGRFQKINEVLNHYTDGIHNTIHLSKKTTTTHKAQFYRKSRSHCFSSYA